MTVLLQGVRRAADVVVYSEREDVVALYRQICRENRQFATLNEVRLDDRGEPDPSDLEQAWQDGARVFRLTPRPA
ncbi:hypothetical protein [Gordonia phthalatica]|uniref:hypothetical protein n=1 Tax=Gordonia phthalatica TaxID=1136941 RepID=UPI000AC083D8|nr:hypothetical protein [Gordonia phthalatica]